MLDIWQWAELLATSCVTHVMPAEHLHLKFLRVQWRRDHVTVKGCQFGRMQVCQDSRRKVCTDCI